MTRFLLKLLTTPALVAALLTTPVLAGATAWQDVAPSVKARLIATDRLEGGRTLVGVEFDMPRSWQIYWRIPGETGIPTELDWTGSNGISDPDIRWPIPSVDRSQGFVDYVYAGPLVLPVELTATADATLSLLVTMGVCSDVCVPASASFQLPLDFTRPDGAQQARLDQALANVPIPWDQPEPAFAGARLAPDGRGVELTAPDAAIDPQSLIADVSDPAVLFGAPQKSPDSALWTLPILGGVEGRGLVGRPIQLTFMTLRGPYVAARKIAPPTL